MKIYALLDPSGKVRYVGKSVNPAKRLRAHLQLARNGRVKAHVYSWLKSINYEVRMILLEDVPGNGRDEERKWIKFYGPALTNLTEGGEGGVMWTPAQRKSISRRLKGRVFSDLHRKRISGAKRGKPLSDEHRKALSLAHPGNRPTPETRRRMSQSQCERWGSFRSSCLFRSNGHGRG